MLRSNYLKHFFLTSYLVICSITAIASEAPNALSADKTIRQLYHSLFLKPKLDMPERIETISALFFDKPYLLGALGEGEHGDFDQMPLYRVDAFDCQTYVDTVLALALANNLDSFKHYIRQVRYHNGLVSFIHRNHFTCLDWNINNQKQGFITDITSTLHNEHGQYIAKTAQAVIDKASWYDHFTRANIRIKHASPQEQTQHLKQLKQKTHSLPQSVSTIAYIPLSALFDKDGAANMFVFNQIPTAAIIEIVRPNWDMQKQIGTHLNVSHLGFAIRVNGTLMFRAATSTNHRVMDCPLIDYLRETQKSPTIKGINIQVIQAATVSKRNPVAAQKFSPPNDHSANH